MLANKRDHVRGTRNASESQFEDQLCHARGCLNLYFENVRLQRIQEALVQQIGRNLIGHCARSFDEHFVGYSRSLRCEDCHSDRGENIEVVRLPWQEWLPVEAHRRELDSGGIDSFSPWPSSNL